MARSDPSPPILQDANELEDRKSGYGIGLDQLIMRVTKDIGIDIEDLISSKRNGRVSRARSIISYLAVNQLEYNGTEVARKLRISGMGVGKCVDRGKKILLCR